MLDISQNLSSLDLSISEAEFIIVGSGLFGLTIAERIANELNRKVLIIEKRTEIGGNAFSYFDSTTGIEVHKYGSHLFHTSNEKVWQYVNRFTEFTQYKHQVIISSQGESFSLPINLHTISQINRADLTPDQALNWIISEQKILKENQEDNFEAEAISKIGVTLYKRFFEGYTQKQWQTKAADLPSEIFSRLPVRFNYNSNYFTDKYQGLPLNGYEEFFKSMIKNDNITIARGVDYLKIKSRIPKNKKIVYTGPIDAFFDYQFGALSWRTIDLKLEKFEIKDFQGCSVKNFADVEIPYTRIHEFKHLHPEREDIYNSAHTLIAYEFSRFAEPEDEPFYPINTKENALILEKYRSLAKLESNVYFGGRLGTYKYLDMHMAIASALTMFENNFVEN
jgi:UDP-galactopyranose mutase